MATPPSAAAAELKRLQAYFEDEASELFEKRQKYDAARTKLLALEERIKALRVRVENESAGTADPSAALEPATDGVDELKREHEIDTGKVLAVTDDNVLSDCAVVLVRTEGPINIGSICRVSANCGVADLRLVTPLCTVNSRSVTAVSCPIRVDYLYNVARVSAIDSDARRFAHHSKSLLFTARVYPTLTEAVSDCALVVGSRSAVVEPFFVASEG
jgi:hypothetical protein